MAGAYNLGPTVNRRRPVRNSVSLATLCNPVTLCNNVDRKIFDTVFL